MEPKTNLRNPSPLCLVLHSAVSILLVRPISPLERPATARALLATLMHRSDATEELTLLHMLTTCGSQLGAR